MDFSEEIKEGEERLVKMLKLIVVDVTNKAPDNLADKNIKGAILLRKRIAQMKLMQEMYNENKKKLIQKKFIEECK